MATTLYRRLGDQFFDANGAPLAAGKLYFYRAGTSTALATYSDAAGVTPNANPVVLNAAGRLTTPVYLGSSYDAKELLTDSDGATVDPWPFDNIPKAVETVVSANWAFPQITWVSKVAGTFSPAASDAGEGYECDTTGGSITFNLPSAATVGNGKGFTFKKIVAANSVTLTPSGTEKIDGASSKVISWAYEWLTISSDGASWNISDGNFVAPVDYPSLSSQNSILIPRGRMTLTSGTPVLAGDVSAATAVYWTPYEGNTCPVYNGTTFDLLSFAELTLTLTAAATASGICDVFAFSNSGALAVGFGPMWATATAGSGARGTGAGTTELTTQSGLRVNKNAITLTNGVSTYSVAAYKATYLGSLSIDGTNGQVSCLMAYGKSRKWGVWNAYNRKAIFLQAGDTGSWTYGTASWRASNGDATNHAAVFTGLAEEAAQIQFFQNISEETSTGYVGLVGIGVNSTSAISGFAGGNGAYASGNKGTAAACYNAPPALGINKFQALENAISAGNLTFYGSASGMQLSASYLG